jgi:hypothetical protein
MGERGRARENGLEALKRARQKAECTCRLEGEKHLVVLVGAKRNIVGSFLVALHAVRDGAVEPVCRRRWIQLVRRVTANDAVVLAAAVQRCRCEVPTQSSAFEKAQSRQCCSEYNVNATVGGTPHAGTLLHTAHG